MIAQRGVIFIFFRLSNDHYLSSVGAFSDVVISIMATLAKIEREKISDRTKAGLERARQQGKQLGRPTLPDEVIEQVKLLLADNVSYRKISEQVTYKAKFGKIKHVSIAQISKIKNR